MKKYITLLTFVCILFLGMNTATAQETPEIKAKMKTLELAKKVELSDAQVKQVYTIYLAYVKENRVDTEIALDKVRSQISNVLEPGQQKKFKASFVKDKERQQKLERGRG